ncbi:MAG: BrnT family toxin [Cyanobacteria bacterium P01_A01_bin.135]
MRFEFDPAKSQANLQKHGIDFLDAQQIWIDSDRIEIPARTVDEPRFLVIGKIAGKVWSAVITYRGESIRIISVRRSRKQEADLYESEGI